MLLSEHKEIKENNELEEIHLTVLEIYNYLSKTVLLKNNVIGRLAYHKIHFPFLKDIKVIKDNRLDFKRLKSFFEYVDQNIIYKLYKVICANSYSNAVINKLKKLK